MYLHVCDARKNNKGEVRREKKRRRGNWMIRREDRPRSDFTLVYINSTISALCSGGTVVYIDKNCCISITMRSSFMKHFNIQCTLNGHYTN